MQGYWKESMSKLVLLPIFASCLYVGGHVVKCLWMLPVNRFSNMSLNMSWQPYEPLCCRVGEEQRSRRERRWEAWPCRWFSQWSNHNYSSESALQTRGYWRGGAHFCCLFFLFSTFISSFCLSVCIFFFFFLPGQNCWIWLCRWKWWLLLLLVVVCVCLHGRACVYVKELWHSSCFNQRVRVSCLMNCRGARDI